MQKHEEPLITYMCDFWPDYEGMDTCPHCDGDISDMDDMSLPCPHCGATDLWEYGYPVCEHCGEHITSGVMLSFDGSVDYHEACVEEADRAEDTYGAGNE